MLHSLKVNIVQPLWPARPSSRFHPPTAPPTRWATMPPRPAAEVAPPIGGGRPRVRCALHVHTNVEIVNYIHIYIYYLKYQHMRMRNKQLNHIKATATTVVYQNCVRTCFTCFQSQLYIYIYLSLSVLFCLLWLAWHHSPWHLSTVNTIQLLIACASSYK